MTSSHLLHNNHSSDNVLETLDKSYIDMYNLFPLIINSMVSENPSPKLNIPDICSRIEIKIEGTDPSRVSEFILRSSLKLLLKGEVYAQRLMRRDFEDGIFTIEKDPPEPLTDDQKDMLEKMADLPGVTISFY